MSTDLKIITLNVNGLRNFTKRKTLFRNFKENNYDVICLQECYITEDVAEQWKIEWGGDLVYSVGTGRSRGQIILLKTSISYSFEILYSTDRILIINLTASSNSYCICNVYAPSSTNDILTFMNNFSDVLSDIDYTNLVICGDFNSVLSNDLDIVSGERHSDTSVSNFINFVNSNSLCDSFRLHNNDSKEYTWSCVIKGTLIARRLDYVFTNDIVFDKILDCSLVSFPQSDHRGVVIKIQAEDIERGAGYWKFNNALLKERDYLNLINATIDNFDFDDYEQPTWDIKWELLKLRIKEDTINYCKKRAVSKRTQFYRMQGELDALEKQLASSPSDNILLNARNSLLIQLEILEQERTQSAQVRSKERWIEEGDKNTKYFLNLEKARANSKVISSLELDDNTILTNQLDILQAQRQYFEDLYKLDVNVNEDNLEEQLDLFIDQNEIPTLNEEQRKSCEGKVTLEELGRALKGLNIGSSPGLDGFTSEFYKVFWGRVGEILVRSFNSSFDRGHLNYSQSSAVITLIHKGKDLPKNKLNNWRPISLTNSDYKILAKTLALRLTNVIDNIVSKDQCSYIPFRDVSDNLRLIDDVIEYLKIKNKPGLLLAIDFSKAFDSISRKFMLNSFKRFGFGVDFQKWVSVLLNNSKSKIGYNGWLSEDFSVERGIKQGCPFSPLAFIISIEYLAIKIRSDSLVKGVVLDDNAAQNISKILKTLLYADDVTLILKDEKDLERVLVILEQFRHISGLSINKTKTEAMWLGSSRIRRKGGFGLKWVDELKILGIYFSNNISASEIDKNWLGRITKCKQIIKKWERRNLSLLGKICVIKSFLAAQFTYVLRSIVIPDSVLSEINSLFFRFLWRRKDCNKRAFEKVKRRVIVNDFSKGGINMVDISVIQKSFQYEWLIKLSKANKFDKWAWIPLVYFSNFGKDMAFLNNNIDLKQFKGLELIKGLFWRSCVTSWVKENNINTRELSRLDSCIWNNPNIKYQNSVLLFSTWAKKGIIYVSDIVSFEDIENLLGRSVNLRFQYMIVYNAITHFFNRTFVDNNDDVKKIYFNDKLMSTARTFKQYLYEANYCIPTAVYFWRNKFGIDLDKHFWELAVKSTKESRLRELHFKILNNIFPTNILLFKIKISTNDKCIFCVNDQDYIEHFFFYCSKIKSVWSRVEFMFYKKFSLVIKLNVFEALLGIIEKNSLTKSMLLYLNHLILIAKMCISKVRYGTPVDISCLFDKECLIRKL